MKKKQKMACRSEEPLSLEPEDDQHPSKGNIQRISARKRTRYAWDHQLYTFEQFVDYYGHDSAVHYWSEAVHFESLQNFCQDFGLTLVRSRYCCDGFQWATSSAMFGLWFPCCLLLVDVHHLEGKLKDSRLDPKNWLPSETAWQIGPAGRENQMQVLEFCTVLHDDTEHLLGKLGRGEMKEVLQDFCAILDGNYAADAECMTGWPCAMLFFFACHAVS